MRTAALLLVAATALMAPATAHAGWDDARATSHRLRPLAAAAPGGVFSVWGAGSATRRLTLPTSAVSRLPYPSDTLSGPWLVNRRGDVLLVDHVGSDGALLVEAGGAQVRMSMEIPRRLGRSVAAALGEDGAAVVAWITERPAGTVWVRVRPPGGQFGPALALPNGAPVIELDADVAPDGHAELVYAVGDGEVRDDIVHTVIAADGTLGPTETVATVDEPLFGVEAVAGRVIYASGREAAATVLTRAGSGWQQQRLDADSAFGLTAHRLADGGVVLAYTPGREVRVRRAAPGGPFGPPQRVSRLPRGSAPTEVRVASSPTGAVLLAWREVVLKDCVRDWCFDRVLAAAADPGQPLGPAQVVSPLGTRTDDIVAALADDGRRLVAWLAAPASESAPGALWTASGDATPEAPVRTDRTPPRVRVLSQRRGKQLRLRLRSNEPVAVRVFVGDTSRGRAVVIPANRATTAVWSLSRYQRAQRSVRIVAADAAGNITRL